MILLFAASVIFTGCRQNDDPDSEYIVINDGTINQNVYADEVAGESGVRITTLAPWSSSIRETTTTSATRNTVDWVSISPESGGVGTYTIMITLEPNFSGNNRSAVIAIESGSTIIEIRITQMGETEEGYVPEPPIERITEIRGENIVGNTSEVIKVKAVGDLPDYELIIAETVFVNNGFTLQLPETVSDNHLMLIRTLEDEFDITMSDDDAKWLIMRLGDIVAYNIDDRRIGMFRFQEEDTGSTFSFATWVYIDRDVVIEASGGCCCHVETWDLSLRKGWNIIYGSGTENKFYITTQKPEGVNLRWEFWSRGDTCCCDSQDFEDWSSRSANTRTTESRRSVFRR